MDAVTIGTGGGLLGVLLLFLIVLAIIYLIRRA